MAGEEIWRSTAVKVQSLHSYYTVPLSLWLIYFYSTAYSTMILNKGDIYCRSTLRSILRNSACMNFEAASKNFKNQKALRLVLGRSSLIVQCMWMVSIKPRAPTPESVPLQWSIESFHVSVLLVHECRQLGSIFIFFGVF